MKILLALALSSTVTQSASDLTPSATSSVIGPTVRFGDYDGDGLLDAYVVNPTSGDRLLRNVGDGTFADVTRESGLSGILGSRMALWQDYDRDGALDLFVCSSQGQSHLMRNLRGGVFADVTRQVGIAHVAQGDLFAEWIDYDADGLADLHVVTERGDELYHNCGGERFEAARLPRDGASVTAVVVPPEALAPHGGGGGAGADIPADPRKSAGRGSRWLPGADAVPVGSGSSSLTSSASPTGASRLSSQPMLPCADTIRDQATSNCIQASSTPALGVLYPLSSILFVSATGKVGVGTTGPSANLHIAGVDGLLATGTLGSGTIPATGAGTRLMWYPRKAAFRAGLVDGAQWDDANIGTFSTAMGERTIASGDHSTAMGLSSTASGERSTAIGSACDAESFYGIALGRFNVGGGTPNSWVSTDPLLEIGNGVSSAARSNAMTVLKNGSVGIGTPTPGNPLQVEAAGTAAGGVAGFSEVVAHFQQSTSDQHGAVSVDAPSGRDSALYLAENGAAVWDLRNDSSASDDFNIRYQGGGGNTTVLTIKTSGDVGIGRNPTGNKLEVEGTASKATMGNWVANSDRRIKTEIRAVEGALGTLERVRPVVFRYTSEYREAHPSIEDKDYYNVIAQEFADVFPEYVKPSGERDFLQVDTYPMQVCAVAAVKELHAIVRERDGRIAELEARLQAQTDRIASLEKVTTKLVAAIEHSDAAPADDR